MNTADKIHNTFTLHPWLRFLLYAALGLAAGAAYPMFVAGKPPFTLLLLWGGILTSAALCAMLFTVWLDEATGNVGASTNAYLHKLEIAGATVATVASLLSVALDFESFRASFYQNMTVLTLCGAVSIILALVWLAVLYPVAQLLRPFLKRTKLSNPAVLIATWFGSGLIPPIILRGMAGTYGSLAAVPLCWLIVTLVREPSHGILSISYEYPAAVWLLYIVGHVVVPRAERLLGACLDWKGEAKTRDQNQIVIDEVFGMVITCWPLTWLPVENWWLAYGLAFGLFRLFDIWKPWPIRKIDAVMLDDAVAGAYAAGCLTIIVHLFDI